MTKRSANRKNAARAGKRPGERVRSDKQAAEDARTYRRRFLPVNREDMRERGWDECDFVYVSGDAYVDHSSFGAAIICRLLEANHYKVGMIAQPDWRNPESVAALGRPRLGFLVSSGNMDSMVNHYTVAKKRRRSDAFSPGGEGGLRPDHAVVVYSNLIRRVFKDVPIIIGGIEASLRRLAHYDYWSDSLKRSILLDSNADLVSYGMGEHSIVEIADALNAGLSVSDLTFIDGTVFRTRTLEHVYDYELLPAYGAMRANPRAYAESFAVQYANSDHVTGKRLVEQYGEHEFVVQNPPAAPLSTAELDAVYRLPFVRAAHPDYDAAGGVPAIKEVKFSLASNRGCFGECAFCALTFHQGRVVQVRSRASLVAEAEEMTHDADFKGYIHDVGGPTANFRAPACRKQVDHGACRGRRCLAPEPCKKLIADHSDYIRLLRELREVPGVKKVFVRSGIRFDYVMLDEKHGREFVRELAEHHVSGQLRVAPEHVSHGVLSCMGKPDHAIYERFVSLFEEENARAGKKQFIVPYLMSSHPGSTMKEAVELAEFVRDMGFNPEQVSDFYPTPGSLATVMYFTGLDPRTMEPIYVPKNPHEKALQRALIQYRDPKNRDLVREALHRAGREDLIGFDAKCLVRPEGAHGGTPPKGKGTPKGKAAPKGDARRSGSSGSASSRKGKQSRSDGGKGKPAQQSGGKDEARRSPGSKSGNSHPGGGKGKVPHSHTGRGKRKETPGEGQRGRGTKRKG